MCRLAKERASPKKRAENKPTILRKYAENSVALAEIDSSVQAVSGRMEEEKVHFEGPSTDRVDHECTLFLNWINSETTIDLVLKAAIAHLWFVTIHRFDDGSGRLGRAIDGALSTLDSILVKASFWEALKEIPLNDRQRKIINRLLGGLQGPLTSSKWAKIAKCSQDTAYRDILDLVNRGILTKDSKGGRSTSYSLTRIL